jgi:hypothetical protein
MVILLIQVIFSYWMVILLVLSTGNGQFLPILLGNLQTLDGKKSFRKIDWNHIFRREELTKKRRKKTFLKESENTIYFGFSGEQPLIEKMDSSTSTKFYEICFDKK